MSATELQRDIASDANVRPEITKLWIIGFVPALRLSRTCLLPETTKPDRFGQAPSGVNRQPDTPPVAVASRRRFRRVDKGQRFRGLVPIWGVRVFDRKIKNDSFKAPRLTQGVGENDLAGNLMCSLTSCKMLLINEQFRTSAYRGCHAWKKCDRRVTDGAVHRQTACESCKCFPPQSPRVAIVRLAISVRT